MKKCDKWPCRCEMRPCFFHAESTNKDDPGYNCQYHSPKGSICLSSDGDKSWVQTSDDQWNPTWESVND